jgi:mono/diheme cytochrome c family protein
MSYQNDILPILQENCYQCHDAQNNFGNVTLEGYNSLLVYVNSGQLIGVINHDSGYSPMPKNASMLLECQIEKIESWITAGSMNN